MNVLMVAVKFVNGIVWCGTLLILASTLVFGWLMRRLGNCSRKSMNVVPLPYLLYTEDYGRELCDTKVLPQR